jgi:conjugative relaxase-like TrwC/TraI family protein
VLSIGKLAIGQASYYLEQAHGSVTRAGALRWGVEDYYLGGPEAAGEWVGDGARLLGLVGTVDAVRLDRVLAGEHPGSGEALGRVVEGRVPGFYLTFSAPKSVSVLLGVGTTSCAVRSGTRMTGRSPRRSGTSSGRAG